MYDLVKRVSLSKSSCERHNLTLKFIETVVPQLKTKLEALATIWTNCCKRRSREISLRAFPSSCGIQATKNVMSWTRGHHPFSTSADYNSYVTGKIGRGKSRRSHQKTRRFIAIIPEMELPALQFFREKRNEFPSWTHSDSQFIAKLDLQNKLSLKWET